VNIARLFNPCSLILFKISVYEIQQADFYITKDDTLVTYRRPRISSKMLPTFSNSDWLSGLPLIVSIVGLNGSTEAGYMPVLVTCPPLK